MRIVEQKKQTRMRCTLPNGDKVLRSMSNSQTVLDLILELNLPPSTIASTRDGFIVDPSLLLSNVLSEELHFNNPKPSSNNTAMVAPLTPGHVFVVKVRHTR